MIFCVFLFQITEIQEFKYIHNLSLLRDLNLQENPVQVNIIFTDNNSKPWEYMKCAVCHVLSFVTCPDCKW